MNTIRILGENGDIRVGKILCLGRNYMEHVKEMKAETPSAPVVFLKPPSALVRNGEPIVFPRISKQLHHEVELVLLIGKHGRNIAVGRGDEYVYGYGIGLDMTLRDIQSEAKKRGLPWSVAKGFDTSAPVSDIVRKDQIPDPSALSFRCLVNGTVRQSGSARDMIIPPPAIVEYISTIFTLERGDLIFTGTPEGVGDVHPGDTIAAELDGYVSTSHPIVAG